MRGCEGARVHRYTTRPHPQRPRPRPQRPPLTSPFSQNFHEFWEEHQDDSNGQKLLQRTNVPSLRGGLSEVEWAIAGMYCVLVFEKMPDGWVQVRVARPTDTH